MSPSAGSASGRILALKADNGLTDNMSVGDAPDRFAGTGARLLPAARVFLFFLVIAVVTALLTVVTGLNGYCGDSGPSDSVCRFHVGPQVALLAVWCPIAAGLVALAVVGLPRFPLRSGAVGGLVTVAGLTATWVLLVHATNERLDYWHNGGSGNGRPGDTSFLFAILFAIATPFAAAAVGRIGPGALRLMAYAGGASAISYLLAFSWTAYYYDRHF
jgi:hypothetical protein